MADIDLLFNILIEKKGSDLHLEESQTPKIRAHGQLVSITSEVLTKERITALLSQITPEEDWQHFINQGDLDFAYVLGNAARFRANYFRHFFGLGGVFRLIPS